MKLINIGYVMPSNNRLIFEFCMFLFSYLMNIGLPLGAFYYSLKRKFKIRLFNFGDTVSVIFFVGIMVFWLAIFVFFSLSLFQTGNQYQGLKTSGVPTEAQKFYQSFRVGSMSLEIGVDFLDLAGKQHKTFVDLDPMTYFLISKESSLWIHYHPQDPQKIALDDFPPRIDPGDIITVFSSSLFLLTGFLVWMRRNYICPICRELNTHVVIRTPNDLRKILKVVQSYVADDTVSVLYKRTPASLPFNRINPDGPWLKELEYLFRCNNCRIEFGLSSRPFRKAQVPFTGTAGRWSPKQSGNISR